MRFIDITMKQGLLTDRQKEVLRYRKSGLTQQQVADIIGTSKANVCTIEKAAYENIERAKETLEFLYTLDSDHLCTIKAGTDLFDASSTIFEEAEKRGIKVKYNTIELINRIHDSNPGRFRARYVREDVEVYINKEGDRFFG
jgi:Tfx family DNA-binding protein